MKSITISFALLATVFVQAQSATPQFAIFAAANHDSLAKAFYNLACTYSLVHEDRKALDYLEKSIRAWYKDAVFKALGVLRP